MTSTLSSTRTLENRARELALTHELSPRRKTVSRGWDKMHHDVGALRKFADNLVEHRAHCTQPAEDWLIDHADFIEKQAQVAVRECPTSVLRQLPALKTTGAIRVYAVCQDFLECAAGLWQADSFEAYVTAYQEVSTLRVAECRALPAMLRRAIVHQLGMAMAEVQHRHEICLRIEKLFARRQTRAITSRTFQADVLADLPSQGMSPVELVHLVQHLNELNQDGENVRTWLSRHVERGVANLDEMVSSEHQLQADLQVTCGHLVQSLHAMERPSWSKIIRRLSNIHHLLSFDAAAEYPALDDVSQEALCSEVTSIATKQRVAEAFVAKTAVSLAEKCQKEHDGEEVLPRSACVAYYLLDADGRHDLHHAFACESGGKRLPRLPLRTWPLRVYLTAAGLVWALLMVVAAFLLVGSFSRSVAGWVAVFAVLAIPISEWAIHAVHVAIRRCCSPRPLLRLDFSQTMPRAARTMVVMPILWSTTDEVDDVIERLEVHHLANRGEHIHFAVLADFQDADNKTDAGDAALVVHALDRIHALQRKYGEQRFYLFHRDRTWNENAKIYMGWERKRGKLVEFVELLRGQSDSFTTASGDLALLPDIQYVFTVDHDTILPLGIVSRLAATMHCLYNRPRLNEAGTRVVEGHGVLQPRVGVSMRSTMTSAFARLWAGEPGVDPYAFAVSDPYQDWFSQAIFVGKGLFDVDVFAQTIVHRMPDNRVLSHDLLEGGFLRAGLAADVEVVDEQPASMYAYQQRLHRWIRGDWQLLPWLRRMCGDRNEQVQPIDLCGVTRWQIVDNLRRSLLAPALFLMSLLGLGALPGRVIVWQAIVFLTLFLPSLLSLLRMVRQRRFDRRFALTLGYCGVQVLTLPFAAVLAADAIVRTLYRICVSRRRLLEWVTSHNVSRQRAYLRVFALAPLGFAAIALYLVIALTRSGNPALVIGCIATFLWLCAYPVVSMLSRPARDKEAAWIAPARSELRQLASDIWAFYSCYVTEQESWLPPDNVQFHPDEKIAHRTSPTNIGFYLASVIAARDFGFISSDEMVTRISKTVQTVRRLEKWHGHLFNWYDTQDGTALNPKYVSTVDSGNFVAYLMAVSQALGELEQHSQMSETLQLRSDVEAIIEETDFTQLFDADARLFALGFHVDESRRETILYDLLASEARQASIVAIALGQIPASHWFSLGRTMTRIGKLETLVSWSGTMFEYFMPWLLLRTYPNTIWTRTYQGVTEKQRAYARTYGVPFGISESGYYAFDYQMNYQYRAFGVPGLGFDLARERSLVIAPYATILAMPFAGAASIAALHQGEALGLRGKFGFYEAVDFTPNRLPAGHSHEVIRSFMAHHQGMSLITLANLLCNETLVDRFHRDPRVKAVDLLLQERVPRDVPMIPVPTSGRVPLPVFQESNDESLRTYRSDTAMPEIAVLSNGNLTSVITNQGAGFVTWKGLAVTRFREDPIVDAWGPALYILDVDEETVVSPVRFPCGRHQDTSCVFSLDKAHFQSQSAAFAMTTDIVIASEMDAEVRRVRIKNLTSDTKQIEMTSFVELSLSKQAADVAHPAFNKLFVETSFDEQTRCLLAKRRPRAVDEDEIWAVHSMFVDGSEFGTLEWDTNRATFIGRGNRLRSPGALNEKLTRNCGAVTDPAFVMRKTARLSPGEDVTLYIVTGMAGNRADAVDIARRISEIAQVEKIFHTAWMRSRIDLRHMNLSSTGAMEAQVLAARLLFQWSFTERRKVAMQANQLGQSALWPHGISGDAPILLIHLSHIADLPFVVGIAQKQQYLLSLGFVCDLVVLDETPGGYQDEVANRLTDALTVRGLANPAHLILKKASSLTDKQRTLLQAVARVSLQANGPSLLSQIHVVQGGPQEVEPEAESTEERERAQQPTGMAVAGRREGARLGGEIDKPSGEFDNGWGRFVEGGQAYQIDVVPGRHLARPWTNVIANRKFGTLITELGTGYTWWRNASECKLTPWNNDPILDPPGECAYLTDAETGETWSPTPRPVGDDWQYRVTHGRGFTHIQSDDAPMRTELDVVVPLDDPLKLMQLTLHNDSAQPRHIRVTYYAEWVIGVARGATAPFIATQWDDENQTLCARNTYQETFREALAFLHLAGGRQGERMSYTGNRASFIGRGGSLSTPAALPGEALANEAGQFANSCGAIQVEIRLEAGETRKVCILFGCTDSKAEVKRLVERYRQQDAYREAREAVDAYWMDLCGRVVVQTPDRAMDIMLNGALLYQALACRMWARTAFYQAGGAFGYRDQLQDGLALLHADPAITQTQILRSARHQYEEGDVQHWWHEETGMGIRTTFSDDLLWLPYVVSRYVEHTGDLGLLDEKVPFLHSEPLKEGETERYEATDITTVEESLLEHCLRAIDHALKFGEHGLPLMGAGDWNDGMSRVGVHGRGESVWLGWFLLDILKRFSAFGDDVLDATRATQFRETAANLERQLNSEAWDGLWFRRAFTDAGKWLGSIESGECRIDAIAQSWATMSGGTSTQRGSRAMKSFDRELVDSSARLAKLLTPAFDETEPSPGYIQAYPPGIRENGGQYTHGVIWGVIAWALLGQQDKAHALWAMLNPMSHTQTSRDVIRYGGEPYVMSADVYTADGQYGRAGWSWYTGAAGWMYQAGLEYVLGIRRRGNQLIVNPCVPADWSAFSVRYRYGSSTYHIQVDPTGPLSAGMCVSMDGQFVPGHQAVTLVDDGQEHNVQLWRADKLSKEQAEG